jgi:hypothetical protein
MKARTRIGIGAIERVQRRMREYPDQEPQDVTKTEAVRRLLPDIRAMQKRGYSLPAIAAVLAEEGIVASAASLKAAMKHATEKRRGKGVTPDVPRARPRRAADRPPPTAAPQDPNGDERERAAPPSTHPTTGDTNAGALTGIAAGAKPATSAALSVGADRNHQEPSATPSTPVDVDDAKKSVPTAAHGRTEGSTAGAVAVIADDAKKAMAQAATSNGVRTERGTSPSSMGDGNERRTPSPEGGTPLAGPESLRTPEASTQPSARSRRAGFYVRPDTEDI